jgi:hypothetical protein
MFIIFLCEKSDDSEDRRAEGLCQEEKMALNI